MFTPMSKTLAMTPETVQPDTTRPDLTQAARWQDYFQLMKPRVMSLVVFTGLTGLLAARAPIHPVLGAIAVLCIAVGAGASGALNMWYDADIDQQMRRTRGRPVPAGKVKGEEAASLGVVLSILSVMFLGFAINWFAAALLAFTIVFYAVVYTMWLKRWTAQNIVIGGLAGALPPAIGWAAATGSAPLNAWLMVAIIFFWTPPHFWALAIHRKEEYAKADIPMLPVTHGEHYTKVHILLYTFALLAVSLLPYVIHMSGVLYLICALALGARFLQWAVVLYRGTRPHAAINTFKYSIWYLFLLFIALLVDHYLLLNL